MIALLRANVTDVTELRKAGSHAGVCMCVFKDKGSFSPFISLHSAVEIPRFSVEFPPPNVHAIVRESWWEEEHSVSVDLTHMRYRTYGTAYAQPCLVVVVWIVRPSGERELPTRSLLTNGRLLRPLRRGF